MTRLKNVSSVICMQNWELLVFCSSCQEHSGDITKPWRECKMPEKVHTEIFECWYFQISVQAICFWAVCDGNLSWTHIQVHSGVNNITLHLECELAKHLMTDHLLFLLLILSQRGYVFELSEYAISSSHINWPWHLLGVTLSHQILDDLDLMVRSRGIRHFINIVYTKIRQSLMWPI